MIAHAMLHVNDIGLSKEFYAKLLAPLQYGITGEYPEWNLIGMGANGKADFWVLGDGAVKATHLAFAAPGKEAVDNFHREGIIAGGKDNGAPGYRKDYGPGYYAAFIYDLDGHNIEAVFMDPRPGA